jgi:putative membrane protein
MFARNASQALAQSKGVQVPSEPSRQQKVHLRKLDAAQGARFDRQYAGELGVAAHEQTVRLFRQGAAQARDPEVKAFAERTLPTLEHHLAMAKELKAAVDKQ